MNYLEHIGIAVKDLSQSILIFEKLLNVTCYKTEVVESENVLTAFFHAGETKIELLQSTSDNSAIEKFISKKGEGIHHLAFEVKDIAAEIERLKQEGFIPLNDEPKQGADGKLICFFHPKHTNGVLIEICQAVK